MHGSALPVEPGVRPVIELQPDLDLTVHDAQGLVEAWLGGPVDCSNVLRLEGGMVNTTFGLDFDRPPHRAVVKLHGIEGDTFTAEAHALEYLRSETACPVPTVYLLDTSAQLIPYSFLLLEHVSGVSLKSLEIDPDERADIDTQLADVLGELHNHTASRWGGLNADQTSREWADLFGERLADVRSDPRVAERLSPGVLHQVDQAIDLARPALGDSGIPTLVHGDVWDGNIMVSRDDGGRLRLSGLLDPDLQFADAEFELAYLEVFDVDREAFFAAYGQYHTLRPGYEQRRLFYWLHTALLHVALFGDEFFCEFTARTAEEIDRL